MRKHCFYNQVGTTTASDFRYIYKADFKIVQTEYKNNTFSFTLEKVINENTSTPSDV